MVCDQVIEDKSLNERIFRLTYGNLVEDFDLIDRSQVEVPSAFVPSASGFGVTTGANLLFLADPQGTHGVSPRWDWYGGVRTHQFKTLCDFGSYVLRGHACTLFGYKQFWSMERKGEFFGEPKLHDVLAVGSTPILFTYPKIAKALAQLCHPKLPDEAEAQGLRWIPITT